ncbi:MSF1-domain-containing protein [Rickenella mellea]|uniref:MSF1-domain-containing protein n=1 Tax=Rickenella mellea TaxID=50990 RepID=A0A4Y7QPI2_9AGAM|nr:MSF1-domain-containing protein [Rickenella mellea]
MVYFSQQFNYNHPWSHVVIGMWHKYPNPHCSHVVTVDVLDRTVDPRTGIIRTERMLGCKQKAPIWVVKLFGGSEDAYVREISFVDPSTQTTSITSVNLSLSQFATCYEQIHYLPSPTNPSTQTVFRQTAEIQARMAIWRSMSDRVENWLAERFEQNALRGKLGFSDVLRSLWDGKEQPHSAHS